MTQVNYDDITACIRESFQRDVPIDFDPNAECQTFIFSDTLVNYNIKFKDLGEAKMYTVDAWRPILHFDTLLRLIAEKNIEMSWCKIYYKDGKLYVSVSSLYPPDVSIVGVLKTILTKFIAEYNNIYDTIELNRL